VEDKPTKHRTRTVVIIVVIAVVLAIAGLGYFYGPEYLVDPDKPGNATSPVEAVQEYLDALVAGDATTALRYSESQPGDDSTFTTDDFLTASMKANPITDVDVPDGQPASSPATIQATYTLNGQNIQAHFTVRKYGRLWRLDSAFLPLNVTELLQKGVPIEVNGVPVDPLSSKISLFPGVYTFSTSDVMLDLTQPDFTIEYPENPTIFRVGFTLSDDGISKIQQAAVSQLDACLSTKELLPDGCGFGFSGVSEGEIDPETITWTLPEDAPDMSTITPALDANSVTVALATIDIHVSFVGMTTDKQHLYSSDDSGFNTVRADFSDPDNIDITFHTV